MAIVPHLEFQLRMMPGYGLLQPLLEAVAVRQWHRHRKPPAPRSVKAAVIRRIAHQGGQKVLIETGTFYGDMLAILRSDFDKLYSIELHPGLANRARRRFVNEARISILVGDSAVVLEPLLRTVGQPVVFWLDGHYSGHLTARGQSDTPILRELDAVFRGGTVHDAVLIDDARLFGVDPDYPSITEIEQRVQLARPGCTVRVEDDIVQILPV